MESAFAGMPAFGSNAVEAGCGRGSEQPRDCADHAPSAIGQSLSALIERMISAESSPAVPWDGRGFGAAGYPAARSSMDTTRVCAEFSIVWPPTIPVGTVPAEVVEVRADVSVDVASSPAPEDPCAASGFGRGAGFIAAGDGCALLEAARNGTDAIAAAAAASSAAAAAASCCCARLLVVREDVVVGEEPLKVDGGRGRVRLRMHADRSGVTSCVLANSQGLPTMESLHNAAPLVGLPQAAREEAHRLLWRMMHEALPPNASTVPFDPEVFSSPFDLLPQRLQAALRWAWAQHFCAFANDLNFLLECLPASGRTAQRGPADTPTTPTAAAAASDATDADPAEECCPAGDAAEVAHYQEVLAQVVAFLRDNEMFACLATLLQTAVSRGLALVHHGVLCCASPGGGGGGGASASASPLRLLPAGSSLGASGDASAALAAALTALQAAVEARDGGDAAAEEERLARSTSTALESSYGDSAPPSPCRPAARRSPGPASHPPAAPQLQPRPAAAEPRAAQQQPQVLQEPRKRPAVAAAAAPPASASTPAAAAPPMAARGSSRSALLACTLALLAAVAVVTAAWRTASQWAPLSRSALCLVPLALKLGALISGRRRTPTSSPTSPTAASRCKPQPQDAGRSDLSERLSTALCLASAAWHATAAVAGGSVKMVFGVLAEAAAGGTGNGTLLGLLPRVASACIAVALVLGVGPEVAARRRRTLGALMVLKSCACALVLGALLLQSVRG